MPVVEKLKMFIVQEPVVAASCLIAGVGSCFLLNPNLKTLEFFSNPTAFDISLVDLIRLFFFISDVRFYIDDVSFC